MACFLYGGAGDTVLIESDLLLSWDGTTCYLNLPTGKTRSDISASSLWVFGINTCRCVNGVIERVVSGSWVTYNPGGDSSVTSSLIGVATSPSNGVAPTIYKAVILFD